MRTASFHCKCLTGRPADMSTQDGLSSLLRQCALLQEKRKRELGQAKKDKNYVEEEKRLARGFGIHSGFDQ